MVSALVTLMLFVGGIGFATYQLSGIPSRKAANATVNFDYSQHWAGWEKCQMVPTNHPNDGGCRILNPNEPFDIAVIGDSHAGHLATGIREIFEGGHENIVTLLYPGCFPVFPQYEGQSVYFDCPDNFIENALNLALQSQTDKTVILAGYGNLALFKNRYSQNSDADAKEVKRAVEALKDGLDQVFSKLDGAGKKTIFVLDNPELKKNPIECVNRPYFPRISNDHCGISRVEYLGRSVLFRTMVGEVAKRHPDVLIVDSADAFCDDRTCNASSNDGVWYYATEDHLSPEGSRFLMEHFARKIFTFLSIVAPR